MKKNIRKIPDSTRVRIETLANPIQAGAVLNVPKCNIERGDYKHLGIIVESNEIIVPPEVELSSSQGKWSYINLYGHEFPRKDLPKIEKTYSFEAPNWGDPSKGYHDVSFTRMVYQKGFIPPRYITFKMELIKEESSDDHYCIKFLINEILLKNSPTFEEDIFYHLNILQENIGTFEVYDNNTTREEYISTSRVDWEIFPPGSLEDFLRHLFLRQRVQLSRTQIDTINERYNVLMSHSPIQIITGTSGFQRYFGAIFSNGLVAFENVRYGNALYLMGNDWNVLSKLSRTQLLKNSYARYKRIIHNPGWEIKLAKYLEDGDHFTLPKAS
jgi:hypothetical protein